MARPSTTSFIDSRQVGQATISVISEGTIRWAPRFQAPEADWRAALPEADADGRITVGMNLLHIQLGTASILVDPGFDDPDDPHGYVFPNFTIDRTPGLTAALDALGVAPVAVTHVVITHAHGDHCVGVARLSGGELTPRFPNARHFIGQADWETVQTNPPAWGPVGERLAVIDRLGLLETVSAERTLVPGVTLLPTPGETRGHLALRLDSAGERCYAVGDLFHHPCEVVHLDWVPPGRDAVATRASRERLLPEAVASRALLVMAHALFPGWGQVVAAGDGYQWRRA